MRWALAVLEPSEAECFDDVLAHQIGISVAGQLEDATARREDATVLVAGNEAGVRRRVVVVEQLEEEPEPAPFARDGLLQDALSAIVVDRAILAVGKHTDEKRHQSSVPTRVLADQIR